MVLGIHAALDLEAAVATVQDSDVEVGPTGVAGGVHRAIVLRGGDDDRIVDRGEIAATPSAIRAGGDDLRIENHGLIATYGDWYCDAPRYHAISYDLRLISSGGRGRATSGSRPGFYSVAVGVEGDALAGDGGVEFSEGVEVAVGDRLVEVGPQRLGRLELGGVGRRVDEAEALGDREAGGAAPSGVVEYQHDDPVPPCAGLAREEREEREEREDVLEVARGKTPVER